ncbi:hypothetical protein [Novosphingopyxis iocasae]|uniref:hypothetical protein n=1 Tax=Novosphingopyxis iocasae TaxID=2762729 RepID=UPI0016513909|nr:hypothetical protein [Novosphingopyxis iocasae]
MSMFDEAPDYEDVRNPNLPWGYWLMHDNQGDERIVDEAGERWRSVRDHFWLSRLGMALLSAPEQEEALEFLLTMLAVIDRRTMGIEEYVHDLFDNDWNVGQHYGQWLITQRLIVYERRGRPHGPLTAEGKAVLLMLASTRSPEHAPIPIGLGWVKARRGLDRGNTRTRLKELLAEQEAFADQLACRFARKTIADLPAIVLIGEGFGPAIPLRRTIWSMTFPDDHARDRFYLWLHERVDRWDAWSEIAATDGGRALSEHLMQLAFADRPIETG